MLKYLYQALKIQYQIFVFLIIFIFISLLFGCVGLKPHISPTPPDLAELQRLAEMGQANKIRAYTGLIGGDTGKLDKTSVASLTNNDLSLVFDVSSSTIYFYKYVSAATDAENSPYFIRPDDYSTSGVHYLLSGFGFGRSATQHEIYRDSDATDFDDNIDFIYDCSDASSGSEDCGYKYKPQIGGTPTIVYEHDDTNGLFKFYIPLNFEDNGIELTDDSYIELDATADGMNDDDYNGIVIGGRNCGEGLSQWDTVYLHTSDSDIWHKADATAASGEYPAQGIVVADCTDTNEAIVLIRGIVRNEDWTGLSVGAAVYLGETNGALTQTAPSTSNDCVQIIGWAISDSEILFDFSRPYQLVE